MLADQVFLIALTLLVVDLEGPGGEVGIVLAAASAPMALALPLGGWIGDRLAPERVLFATNVAQALLTVGIAVLLLADSDPSLVAITALVAVMGAVDGVAYPTAFAFPPRVVPPEELPQANALIQGAETMSDLAGGAVAALLIGAIGLGATFSVVAALSVLGALILLRGAVRAPARIGGARSGGPLHELGAGLRHARADPQIRALLWLIAALCLTATGPYFVGLAALAETELGGAESLGLIFTAFGAGALLGLFLAARIPAGRGAVLSGTSVVIGLGLAAMGFATSLVPVLILSAVVGVAEALLDVVLYTWLQQRVPGDVLGRVMSLVVLAEVVTEPLSFAAAGLLLEISAGAVLVIGGGLMTLAGALAALSPSLRRL